MPSSLWHCSSIFLFTSKIINKLGFETTWVCELPQDFIALPEASVTNYTLTCNSYRKIPKISPGVYIFKGPFWGAYFWRGLCTEGNLRFKVDWASLQCEGIYHFWFALLCIWEQIPCTTPPWGLYLERRFNGRVFCVTILRGLYMEGLIFGILRYIQHIQTVSTCLFSETKPITVQGNDLCIRTIFNIIININYVSKKM